MVFYYFYYFQLYQMLTENKETDDHLNNPVRSVATDSKFFFGVTKSENRPKDSDPFQKLEGANSS